MFYHVALFAGGTLFGTAGLKILGSKEAKKIYAHTVAIALRAKDSVMSVVDNVRECSADIIAEANDINEKRMQEMSEIILDAEEEAEEDKEKEVSEE